jgi:uncharacterized membrane protein
MAGAIQRSTVIQPNNLDDEVLGLCPELTASIALALRWTAWLAQPIPASGSTTTQMYFVAPKKLQVATVAAGVLSGRR